MFATALIADAQTPETFRPYKATQLRLPSVPLVVSDPYLSVWSPYDRLTDGATAHWTGDEKPLEGLLRVDGKTYRFMGAAESQVLESIVPMADEGAWTATYTRKTPNGNWTAPDYDTNGWSEGSAAFGSEGLAYVNTVWGELNSDIYVRRTVNLSEADLKGELWVMYSHDDNFGLYIIGT